MSNDPIGDRVRENLRQADELDAEAKAIADRNRVYRQKARNLRISAGMDLVRAQRLVQQEGLIWEEWCKTNFPQHSAKKIARLIRSVR